jgi:hypothetical protein
MVVAVGLTIAIGLDTFPGFHVYEVAPEADSTTELPLHINVLVLDAVSVGDGDTTTLTVLVEVQPTGSIPVNV